MPIDVWIVPAIVLTVHTPVCAHVRTCRYDGTEQATDNADGADSTVGTAAPSTMDDAWDAAIADAVGEDLDEGKGVDKPGVLDDDAAESTDTADTEKDGDGDGDNDKSVAVDEVPKKKRSLSGSIRSLFGRKGKQKEKSSCVDAGDAAEGEGEGEGEHDGEGDGDGEGAAGDAAEGEGDGDGDGAGAEMPEKCDGCGVVKQAADETHCMSCGTYHTIEREAPITPPKIKIKMGELERATYLPMYHDIPLQQAQGATRSLSHTCDCRSMH